MKVGDMSEDGNESERKSEGEEGRDREMEKLREEGRVEGWREGEEGRVERGRVRE